MANFLKLFWCNLRFYQLIALSFDSGYADRSTNFTEKKFYGIDTSGQFLKTFFGVGYADRSINFTEKSFMKLTPVVNFIKL